jgi:hypothetical protein
MSTASNASVVALERRIRDAERTLRSYLNDLARQRRRWLLLDDPVRTKNLEKVTGYLQSLLSHLHSGRGAQAETELSASLDQIEVPSKLSSSSAWELADALEVALIRVGDDAYIHTLLKAESSPDGSVDRWDKRFSAKDLKRLQSNYSDGNFRHAYALAEARCFLEYLRHSQTEEYRRDRAKIRLRGKYLLRMVLILAALVFGLCYFLLATSQAATGPSGDRIDSNVVWLMLLSGAVGSVLSRAIKLGKQPLHEKANEKLAEPLGIRALMSGWTVFLAQPVIGATSGLVLYLVFQAGLVQIGDERELGPAAYTLLGFLAGFSEPFFLGTLDKVTGQAAPL